MGGWRDEWETEGYRIPLSEEETDFLRVRMRIERGMLTRFTVQYEAVVGARTYAVIRYDNAHGTPHRDTLDWNGSVIHKVWLPGKPYHQVLKEGTDDIKTDWPAYREAFERMEP